MEYKHFVITRFNIRVKYNSKLKNPDNNPMDLILDPTYLERRFELFEKYTFPSLKNQTSQNFEWVILFHKNTPEEFKKKINDLKKIYGFIDYYLDDSEHFKFSTFVTENIYKNEWFITSRIDNDDIFDLEYIEKTQEYAKSNLHQCIVSFEKGEKLDIKNDKKYPYIRKDNHFLSMIAPKEFNILQYNHSKIFESGQEVVMIPTKKPMWVEIIHETNVTNNIKDNHLGE